MSTITRLNKAPPVKKRPRCPWCSRPLRPYWEQVGEKRLPPPEFFHYTVEFRGTYHGYGAFDTMACATAYANAVIKSGAGPVIGRRHK